jgi:hypothetical protein
VTKIFPVAKGKKTIGINGVTNINVHRKLNNFVLSGAGYGKSVRPGSEKRAIGVIGSLYFTTAPTAVEDKRQRNSNA